MAPLFQEIIWHSAQAKMLLRMNQLHSLKQKKNILGTGLTFSKHFVVSVFDKENMQKISMYPADSAGVYRFGFEEQVASSSGEYINKTSVFLGPNKKRFLKKLLLILNTTWI